MSSITHPRYLISMLLAIAACIVIAWIHGLIWFAQQIPDEPIIEAPRADAIVVLTGGSKRIQEGLRLLIDQKAPRLFISGVHSRTTIRSLLRNSHVDLVRAPCCIELGYTASNTQQNTIETLQWAQEKNVRKILLVTASYHMPRAMFMFNKTAERLDIKDIQIIAYPVFPEDFHYNNWWKWPLSVFLVLAEYNKYIFEMIRHHIWQWNQNLSENLS